MYYYTTYPAWCFTKNPLLACLGEATLACGGARRYRKITYVSTYLSSPFAIAKI